MVTLTDGRKVEPAVMKALFLEKFPELANVSRTCDSLKLTRRTIYHWKKEDPDFKKAFEEADAEALQILEDEAYRRAVEGVNRPVYQGGQKVGEIKEYSDTLLIVLLKARAPQKYKERFSAEITDPNKPMQITHVHSPLPLAGNEDDIQLLEYEEIPNVTPVNNPTTPPADELSSL